MTAKTTRRGWLALVAAAAVVGLATGASAAPVSYVFQSGQIRIEASAGTQVLGLSDVADLSGFGITVDTDAGVLNSLLLTSGGPVDFTLSPGYAGYDFMSLTDISLSGGPGTLNLLISGPPDIYSYTLDPLNFSATLDASGPVIPDATDVAIASVTDGAGFITVDTVNSALFLQGVTIGQFGPFPGETNSLVLKADLVFQGVIPEPGGERLMGLGILIVGLAGLGRRSFA